MSCLWMLGWDMGLVVGEVVVGVVSVMAKERCYVWGFALDFSEQENVWNWVV